MQQVDSIGHHALFTSPPFLPEQYCCFSIHGDSMEPDYKPNMLLIVDMSRTPESGDHVIAESPKALLFRQLVDIDGQRYLKPLNDRYPTRLSNGSAILGVVIYSLSAINDP